MISTETRPRCTVLFHRFGPYHCARIEAAARHCRVDALELSAETAEYAWDKVQDRGSFQRLTLFQSVDSRRATCAELTQKLADAFVRIRPETIVIPGWSDKGALASLRWCALNGAPAVVMSDSTAWDVPRNRGKEWVKRRIVGLCSAGLVAGAPHADYLASLGMPRKRICLGYDVVDNEYFRANAEKLKSETLKGETRSRYGLPERYFLASARFVANKNLLCLLRAYAIYRQKAETLKAARDEASRAQDHRPRDLVLLGDGPFRATLDAQLSTLNLRGHVHMPGFKQYPDLPAYYGLADAFIHVSMIEPWGLVVNEAMASGLPVLVSNRCGCASDLVQEGVNGFTFDPYDTEGLARLMLKLSTLNSQLSTMGAASQRIIAEWGPERFASGLKAAVDCAIAVGPKRASLLDRMLLRLLLFR